LRVITVIYEEWGGGGVPSFMNLTNFNTYAEIVLGFLDLSRTLDSKESDINGYTARHKTSCFIYTIIACLLSAPLSLSLLNITIARVLLGINDLHITWHVEFANADCFNR
jgi:hypothetical protein